MSTEAELIWHDDGHSVELRINRSNLEIVGTVCPNGDFGECRLPSQECAVVAFIHAYGMECNVGVCKPAPIVEIAWALVGDKEMGFENCQVWFIPTTDEIYTAWKTAYGS